MFRRIVVIGVVLLMSVVGRASQVNAVNVAFTNNTGQPAGHFVLIASITVVPASLITQPPGCGTPEKFSGFEYVEFIWPTACIGSGESIVLDTVDPTPLVVFDHFFVPSPPVISALNDTGGPSDALLVDITSVGGVQALTIQNAPGCPEPVFSGEPGVRLDVIWDSPCVDPGEKVEIHIAGGGAGGFNITNLPFSWRSPPVGGTGREPDVVAAPLALHDSSGDRIVTFLALSVTVAALAVALGAAWYARRRWLR